MSKTTKNPKLMKNQNDSRFHAIFENSFNAILLGTPDDGLILEANAAASKMFGYSIKELRSLKRSSIFDISNPEMTYAL